ncbi:uncharacterized protein MEPE_02537 [Melanopsichium pennsylvanicum]|uniref:Uncharacterized protein n=1 Tax=Melanopsichium pennsylvanicum TaxID=63383 RepID=A0AAJ4XJK3_9BASI|nr:uncharacterized protein MEPE_02537 [Melanopsichium pennsylvanicum]
MRIKRTSTYSFGMRLQILFMLISTITISSMVVVQVEAKTQRVGDECNWSKNCQQNADGVGPAWANGEITCAIPQNQSPETCSSHRKTRNAFWGTCKAVGTLTDTEYGCPCGVHKGNCPISPMFERIFDPAGFMQKAYDYINNN